MRSGTIIRSTVWAVATAVLAIGWGNGCADDPLREPAALTATAAELNSSEVTLALGTPIRPGHNLLWCATAQWAWDAACAAAGGDLHFAPPDDPTVAGLNRHAIAPELANPDSFVAVAGRVRDGIYGRIDRAIEDKFHGHAAPKMQPKPGAGDRMSDLIAYCFLFEKIDFPAPFERLEEPLRFAGADISAFGMGRGKPGHDAMARGVTVHSYRGPDDFIVDLATQSPQDHVILAKVKPEATLAETIASVAQRRLDDPGAPAQPHDVLIVPRMNFDVTRELNELTGRPIFAPPALAADHAEVLRAEQNIRFLMNEKGVVLQSETSMSIGCSVPPLPPEPTHVMVFDKPFLLLIDHGEHGSHFVLWIDNAELLVPARR